MSSAVKSIAKSLPYPVFLRLYYGWERFCLAPRAEFVRRSAGIPLLEEVDLRQFKGSDSLFILGSRPSINRISDARWSEIKRHDTVGFNWWLYHPLIPKFYFLESFEREAAPEHFECYLSLARARAADYAGTIKIAMELHKPGTQTVLALDSGFKQNLFAAHSVAVPARDENELACAFRYLQRTGSFNRAGRFSHLLKHAASLTSLLVFAVKLGYKRVVLCGIDLKTSLYFFQERSLYSESWEMPSAAASQPHETDVQLTWRVPVSRVVACIKRLIYDPSEIQLLVESRQSALWPMLKEAEF
jgi:hypothetical protein